MLNPDLQLLYRTTSGDGCVLVDKTCEVDLWKASIVKEFSEVMVSSVYALVTFRSGGKSSNFLLIETRVHRIRKVP